MSIQSLNHAIILITGGEYAITLYRVRGERYSMSDSAVMPISQSFTGGKYGNISRGRYLAGDVVLTSDERILTSDDSLPESEGLKEISSTESGKNISGEKLVSMMTAIMPEVKDELDLIIRRSKNFGSIDVYLDSINENIFKLRSSFEKQRNLLESIESRL